MQKVGLSQKEAHARLKEYGPNTAHAEKSNSALRLFLANFKSPLVLLLLLSAIISAYFGEPTSAIIIVVIVLLSAVLDFLNSYKSDKAAQQLKDRVRITATVFRDGKKEEVRIDQIVPGDAVILDAGDIIPADGVVLEGRHLFINESSLTGESFPQPKDVNAPLYMGSSVASGEGILTVTETGVKTKFNHIVAALSQREVETEFDREIKGFSFLILKITVVLVVFVFAVNFLLKNDLLGSLLFAVALAVGITPELLPMIITLNLTKGSLAMAKRGVIVKRLSAIQNFGSMDILCTDKTGTLTEDRIVLVQHVDIAGSNSEETLLYAYLNSHFCSSYANPLDEAVRGFKHLSVGEYKKVDEMPFDFVRRRESIVVAKGGKKLLVTKGAPEEIFRISAYCGSEDCTFPGKMEKTALETYHRLSNGGFRVLAVARRELKGTFGVEEEKDLIFVGFIAFLDPPKSTVARTLEEMHRYGIRIKIITGDNELVTRHIAEDIRLHVAGVLRGTELDRLSDAELKKRVEKTSIFSRVNPEQKMRIIQTLQANGHVVGYMGDGINDAPSLKAADVGISVNNAADVAKEAADLILLHKSLADLVEGVVEGRKTFANTLKYLMMVLSSNFGNVFSMAGASIFLPFLPMLPTQILLNNLLYDVSQFTLPLDSVDNEELFAPRRFHLGMLRRFMIVFGPISSLFDFLTFGILMLVFHLSGSHFQTGWFIESLATQVLVVHVIRTKRIPFLQSRPSFLVLVGTVGVILIGWMVALGSTGHWFRFTGLSPAVTAAIWVTVAMYLVVVELCKRLFYARQHNQQRSKSGQDEAALQYGY